MKKLNPFFVKCVLTANWKVDYPIAMRAQDVAEAAFRELREGDYDETAFRDTTDEIKEQVKDWLMTDPKHVNIWSGVEKSGISTAS